MSSNDSHNTPERPARRGFLKVGGAAVAAGAALGATSVAQAAVHAKKDAPSAEHREAIYAAGGVWHLILKYAFAKFADDCDAFFGHCGDARALEVAQAAGFVKTDVAPIIVNWHKPMHEVFKRALLAKVVALGPF